MGNRTETRGNSAANNVQERKQPNSEACQGLFTAVELNDALTLRELLDGGDVDKDSTDKNGNTPLHVAAEMGHKAVAQVVVSAYTSNPPGGHVGGLYIYVQPYSLSSSSHHRVVELAPTRAGGAGLGSRKRELGVPTLSRQK